MKKALFIVLACLFLVSSSFAWFGTSLYRFAINCSGDYNTPIMANSTLGFYINGDKQRVWTECQPEAYVYYNSSTDYIIANATSQMPSEVEFGNGTSYNPTSIWQNVGSVMTAHVEPKTGVLFDSAYGATATAGATLYNNATGLWGNAIQFTGGGIANDIYFAHDAKYNVCNLSIEVFWASIGQIRVDDVLSKADAGNIRYGITTNGVGKNSFAVAGTLSTSVDDPKGGWAYSATAFNPVSMYYGWWNTSGNFSVANSSAITSCPANNTNALYIGANPNYNQNANFTVEEIRLYNVSKSISYFTTVRSNQNGTAGYGMAGPIETSATPPSNVTFSGGLSCTSTPWATGHIPVGTQYTLNGVQFTIGNTNTITTGCTNLRSLYLTSCVSDTSGVSSNSNVTYTKFIQAASGGYFYLYNISLSTIGNYTIYTSSPAVTGITEILCKNQSNINPSIIANNKHLGAEQMQITMIDYNSTDYKFIVNGAGADPTYNNTFCSKDPNIATLSIYIYAGSTADYFVSYPNYNVSKFVDAGTATTCPSALTPQLYYPNSPMNYIGLYGSSVLRSDLTTSKSSAPNNTNFMQALLQGTGQSGTFVITPRITYFPSDNSSFAYLINSSSTASLMLNNTLTYVLDQTTNLWFVCPAYIFFPPAIGQIQCLNTNIPGTGNGTGSPNFQYIFSTVTTGLYPLSPQIPWTGNNTTITYFAFSSNNTMNYFGMNITYRPNSTANFTTIYFQNITTITGGTLQFNVNAIGTYNIYTWFNVQNFPTYYPFTTTFRITNTTGLIQLPGILSNPETVSGWAYYFIAVVVSMCVVGYVSKYTINGAGIIGVLVLAGFTLLNPNAVLVPSMPLLTTTTATIITAIAVFAVTYLRYSAENGGG